MQAETPKYSFPQRHLTVFPPPPQSETFILTASSGRYSASSIKPTPSCPQLHCTVFPTHPSHRNLHSHSFISLFFHNAHSFISQLFHLTPQAETFMQTASFRVCSIGGAVVDDDYDDSDDDDDVTMMMMMAVSATHYLNSATLLTPGSHVLKSL